MILESYDEKWVLAHDNGNFVEILRNGTEVEYAELAPDRRGVGDRDYTDQLPKDIEAYISGLVAAFTADGYVLTAHDGEPGDGLENEEN